MMHVLHDVALLVPGMVETLKLTALTLAVAVPTTLVVAVALSSTSRTLTMPLTVVIEVLRGMPALATLYLVYYGLPAAHISFSETVSIVIAFGLTFVAYTGPILAAAIAMVPRGQIEAGYALGLSRWTVTTEIVLPQAVRMALPTLMSWAVIMFQGTSLASVVGASDVFGVATGRAAQEYRYTYWLVLASIFYAAVSIPLLVLAGRLQRRGGVRSRGRRAVFPVAVISPLRRRGAAAPRPEGWSPE